MSRLVFNLVSFCIYLPTETYKQTCNFRKSLIGSNIHIEVNDFLLTLDRVFETINDVSASQLEVLVT